MARYFVKPNGAIVGAGAGLSTSHEQPVDGPDTPSADARKHDVGLSLNVGWTF